MAILPRFNTTDQSVSFLQTAWSRLLDPLIASPIANPIVLKNVALKSGNNTINHMLKEKLTGWIVIRQRALAQIYDEQDSNLLPDQTLVLNASTAVVVDLLVF